MVSGFAVGRILRANRTSLEDAKALNAEIYQADEAALERGWRMEPVARFNEKGIPAKGVIMEE